MNRSHRRAMFAVTLATAACVAVTVVAVSGLTGDENSLPPPDRAYRHEALGFSRMLDIVCESAMASVTELGATMVQTSLDPVTGTPRAWAGSPPVAILEWVEARVPLGAGMGEGLLSVEIGAAGATDGSGGGTTGGGVVAVRVRARPSQADPSADPAARQLTEALLKTLDQEVTHRIRSAEGGGHHGPTPTPWIGPPLEPTPVGPPELIPPSPGPRS